jgi:hypothetical protein
VVSGLVTLTFVASEDVKVTEPTDPLEGTTLAVSVPLSPTLKNAAGVRVAVHDGGGVGVGGGAVGGGGGGGVGAVHG